MSKPLLTCPSCDSEHILVKVVAFYDVNTGYLEKYVSWWDEDEAEATCLDCEWDGLKRDLDTFEKPIKDELTGNKL